MWLWSDWRWGSDREVKAWMEPEQGVQARVQALEGGAWEPPTPHYQVARAAGSTTYCTVSQSTRSLDIRDQPDSGGVLGFLSQVQINRTNYILNIFKSIIRSCPYWERDAQSLPILGDQPSGQWRYFMYSCTWLTYYWVLQIYPINVDTNRSFLRFWLTTQWS